MSGDSPWWNRASDQAYNYMVRMFSWPGEKIRDLTAPIREKNKQVYYHRKFKRVTPIEDCEEDDALCLFEADQQFIRDKAVDDTILLILRQRLMECAVYYGQDSAYKCKKESEDLTTSENNHFAKYGDLGTNSDRSVVAFRKQQHRMIWERRNGKSLIDGSPLPSAESSES